MFDYTRDYIEVLKRDFKRADLAFSIINIIATIVYPIFAIIAKLGNLYINIAVLILALIYSGLQLFIGDSKKLKMDRVYTWSRIALSTVALCINIYSIYVATTNVNGVAIILATIMTIFWILKVLVNLLYDILMPRLQTLGLCLIEDSKPYCKKADFVSELVTRKPLFNLSEETPEEVKRVVSKSRLAHDSMKREAINKEIKNEYLSLMDNDGSIELTELIIKGLSLDNVIVDKKRFMHQEFSNSLDNEALDRLIRGGATKAGLTPMELSYYVDKLVAKNQANAATVKGYMNDSLTLDYKNDKEFRRLLEAFSLTLICMQKIIYMYGFKQIDKDNIGDLELTALILALSIALDDENKLEAKEELLKLRKRDIKDDLINMAASKLGFVRNHQEELKNGLMRAIPVVTKILGAYSKGKVGLALKATSLAMDLTKSNK